MSTAPTGDEIFSFLRSAAVQRSKAGLPPGRIVIDERLVDILYHSHGDRLDFDWHDGAMRMLIEGCPIIPVKPAEAVELAEEKQARQQEQSNS